MFLVLFLLVPWGRGEEEAGTAQWWTQKVEEDLPRLQTPEKRVGVLGRLAILEAGRGEGGRASAFLQRLETELEAGAAPEWQPYAREVEQTLIILAAGKQIEEWVAKGDLDAARAFVANAETHPDFRALPPEAAPMIRLPLMLQLAEAGDPDGAWGFLREFPGELQRELGTKLLIREGLREGITVDALRARAETHFPDRGVNSLYQPGRELARKGHADTALGIARAIGSERALSNISRDLARHKALAGDVDGAAALMDQITDPGDITNTLMVIAGQAASAGDVDRVRWTMARGDERGRELWGWPNLVAAMVHAGELEEARRVLREALPEDEQNRRRMYSRSFRAFVDSGQLDEAEAALEKLESSDRIGERISLAGAHARQGRADKAREMLAGVLAEVEDMRGEADARPQTIRRHLEAILIQALELKDMPTVNRLTEADAYFRDLLLSEIFREFVFGEHAPAELAALWREMEDPAARLSFALAVAERITHEPLEDPHL